MALAIHLNSTIDVQHFTKFFLTGSSVIGHILTAMTGAILRARFAPPYWRVTGDLRFFRGRFLSVDLSTVMVDG